MVRTPEPRGRAGYLERARVPLLLPLLLAGGAEVPVVPPLPLARRRHPSLDQAAVASGTLLCCPKTVDVGQSGGETRNQLMEVA